MDHPQPFDATVSLMASDLELTFHRGNPASAIEAAARKSRPSPACPGFRWTWRFPCRTNRG